MKLAFSTNFQHLTIYCQEKWMVWAFLVQVMIMGLVFFSFAKMGPVKKEQALIWIFLMGLALYI